MRARWIATVLSVVLLLGASARAQERRPRVGFDYRSAEAPSDCPDASGLRAAVSRQLGYDPFASQGEAHHFDLRVDVVRVGPTTEARIAWLAPGGATEGERQLTSESPRCAELADALVFAIAVQIQLRASSLPPEPERPKPIREPRPNPPKPPPRERAVLVGAGILGRSGLQPKVSPGLRSFGLLRGRAWSLGLDAHATLPTTERFEGGSGFAARELGLNVTPCLRYGPVDACALGFGGLLLVRGEGVDQVRAPSSVMLGAGVRLQLVFPELGRAATLAHVDVAGLFTPRDVELNHGVVWSTAPIVATLGFDLAAIFR